MALPFLPAEEIPAVWRGIKGRATTSKLKSLVSYVEDTWLNEDGLWPPSAWSVFNRAVRTNNDVEGWPTPLTTVLVARANFLFTSW